MTTRKPSARAALAAELLARIFAAKPAHRERAFDDWSMVATKGEMRRHAARLEREIGFRFNQRWLDKE